MSNPQHISVLCHEVLEAFASPPPRRIFIDATIGAGGHSQALLNAHPELQLLIGMDQDPEALELARSVLSKYPIVALHHSNFACITECLASSQVSQVDGILIDLGVSSMQLDRPEKGFSFSKEGPLDMRMDPTSRLTAAEIVNRWSEQKLGQIFREYGEEPRWRLAASVIVQARRKKPIQTTQQLATVLRPALSWRRKGFNPLTLVFQALRIAVNHELEVLQTFIPQALALLAPQGRLAVISFHSLEDRIVKQSFMEAAPKGSSSFRIVTRKPIQPSEEEIKKNPRSRSAKLRIIERL